MSREHAKAVIMSGAVFVNGMRADKPGMSVNEDSDIELRSAPMKYVSRGGLKLEKAIEEFGIELEGLVALDVGASTGGFTDCILRGGAKKVYAIDVGYGQLAWSIRNDPRVVTMERTNIRYVRPEHIGEMADFCSIDVSFISLALVLPAVRTLLKERGCVVCLIKPQFEAGRENVGKKGVVRDAEVHVSVLENFVSCARRNGFALMRLAFSPIKGPEGNIEYLAHLILGGTEDAPQNIRELVSESHRQLSP